MKYNIIRVKAGSDELEGETIATGLTTPEFNDDTVEGGKTYQYIVEAYTDDGKYQDRNLVVTKTEESLPKTTIFESNAILIWDKLPAYGQSNNGSLTLLSTETRDNVPVHVETGEVVERLNDDTGEMEQIPKTVVEYQTRAIYTYEADFEWDNSQGTGVWGQDVTWLVDVLQFKNNRLRSGSMAFAGPHVTYTHITALPDLDTSNLTSMWRMFRYADFFNQPLDNWDTSNVIDMHEMFPGTKVFDQDISNWCVEKISSKPDFFDSESAFYGQTAKQPQWGKPC